MYELLIHLAELLGGTYTLFADGTLMADDLLGSIAGCGAIDPDLRDACVIGAIDFIEVGY